MVSLCCIGREKGRSSWSMHNAIVFSLPRALYRYILKQGIHLQYILKQGIHLQYILKQGIRLQYILKQGIHLQYILKQGIRLQYILKQGIHSSSVSLHSQTVAFNFFNSWHIDCYHQSVLLSLLAANFCDQFSFAAIPQAFK